MDHATRWGPASVATRHPNVNEKQFQAQVLELAGLMGWKSYHTFDSRRSAKGFPDLVLVRGGRMVVAELKTMRGYTSPDQREWLCALRGVPGVTVRLWRPSDWEDIERVLGEGRIQQPSARRSG